MPADSTNDFEIDRPFERPRLSIVGGILIVLAGLLLVAILTPNFYTPVERSMRSRAQSDMRSIGTALDAFHEENGHFPSWVTGRDPDCINHCDLKFSNIPSFRLATPAEGDTSTYTLTTPVSYIRAYYNDPFSSGDVEIRPGAEPQYAAVTMAYYATENGWILGSRGPDHDFDAPYFRYRGVDYDAEQRRFARYTYDPTNGLKSSGDVIKFVDKRPVRPCR